MQIFNIASIYKGVVNSDSFSVHDFDILTLYPLDFEEFLWANAEFALTREIRNHFSDFSPMGKKLHEKALSQFRLYLIIGGMPAAIMEYKKKRSSCWYLTPSKSSLHLYPVDTGLCSCILKIPAFQLLSGEETTAGTACIETFLAQHFIRNGYALSYWSSGNQAEVPFLLSKNSHFIAIDYRTAPHQKCRNLMQLNKSSLSPAPTQMYLISAEDFRQKEAYRIVPLYAVFCI